MARDYIDIGPAPGDEDCVQVGAEDYDRRARAECNRYIEEIRAVVGAEPEGARLAVKSNPHDFGAYLSVVCYYEDSNDEATSYAFRCENNAPRRWTIPSRERDTTDRICNSCLSAAQEETGELDQQLLGIIMAELGSDLADHLCDQVEDPNLPFHCLCACQRR